MSTLLISRSQAEAYLDLAKAVVALREGFVSYARSKGARALRVRSDLTGPGTATVLFPGHVPGMPAYTVKVHAKFPDQQPAIQGVLCLNDIETGRLLAIMDSTYLTAVRTGLAGALAAHVLARPDASSVAIIGAGVQGRQQLVSLAKLRRLDHVRVFDTLPAVAEKFSEEMKALLGLPVESATSVAAAVADAGIVMMATWAREPLIMPGMLVPGAHVTTLGADEPGKVEVTAEVIKSAAFFCDDADLAVQMGALGGAGLDRRYVASELGEVLSGDHPGRKSEQDVTVYGGVGLAFQDAVCAWLIYKAARDAGAGHSIEFTD